jgi:hypothetical protein
MRYPVCNIRLKNESPTIKNKVYIITPSIINFSHQQNRGRAPRINPYLQNIIFKHRRRNHLKITEEPEIAKYYRIFLLARISCIQQTKTPLLSSLNNTTTTN